MNECKHDVNFITYDANGLYCRLCGKRFKSLNTLGAEIAGEVIPEPEAQAAPAAAKPKRTRKPKAEKAE